jgi:CrcB protein
MNMLLAVAAGGALGAVGRHLFAAQIGHLVGPHGIAGVPVGILATNVVGSFVMGVLAETMALVWSPSGELRAFLTVGLLGAFTTFSTFSLEAALLVERHLTLQAAAYMLASVGLSIAGLFAGMWGMRWLLT